MRASPLLHSPIPPLSFLHRCPPRKPPLLKTLSSAPIPSTSSCSLSPPLPLARAAPIPRRRRLRNDFRVWSEDGEGEDIDPVGGDEEEEEHEERTDLDLDLDHEAWGGRSVEIEPLQGFVSMEGDQSEASVTYRINEDEFHRISLLHCDFFIRKQPDPDGDLYDLREVYVSPPDTDSYSLPSVLAPMPQKYIRCSKSDYGCWDVTEPDVEGPRDPLYKSVKEVHKVFLIKHHENSRLTDPEFAYDFEEIYVIDSNTKSITRAKVVVTVPEGRNRDRKRDLLTVRDNGTTFTIIDVAQREHPEPIIEREEWIETREEFENHLRKLRDFSESNWF